MGRDNRYDDYKKNKSPLLKGLRHGAEYLALKSFNSFCGMLSIKQNQALGRVIGRIAEKTATKDKKIAAYQLEFCFPELDEEERAEILHHAFENAGETMLETLAMDKFRAKPEEWITLKGQEIMEEAVKKEKGAILVFGHIGNWELIPIIYEMLNIQGFAIASPIGEAKLDNILGKKRFSENIEMIPRGDKKAARNILSAFRNNRVMLFALDQDMNVQSHFVDFFGRKAATAKGAANLAMKFDAPVMSCFGFRDEVGKHHYEIKLLSDGPYEKGVEEEIRLTQDYTRAIETKIKAHPSQWVWFHRRWKTQPDEVE